MFCDVTAKFDYDVTISDQVINKRKTEKGQRAILYLRPGPFFQRKGIFRDTPFFLFSSQPFLVLDVMFFFSFLSFLRDGKGGSNLIRGNLTFLRKMDEKKNSVSGISYKKSLIRPSFNVLLRWDPSLFPRFLH